MQHCFILAKQNDHIRFLDCYCSDSYMGSARNSATKEAPLNSRSETSECEVLQELNARRFLTGKTSMSWYHEQPMAHINLSTPILANCCQHMLHLCTVGNMLNALRVCLTAFLADTMCASSAFTGSTFTCGV